MGRLADKVAIVTGAAAGIGRAVAERIVVEGGRVVAGDIDVDGLAALSESLGEQCAVLRCDVTTEDGTEALAALAIERFGRLDIAVANAGGGVACSVAFLASDDAAFITGTTLLVDGGAHHLGYPDTGGVRARADRRD